MAKTNKKTKIRQMAPEKLAARKDDALRRAVNDVGASIGLPEIQRDIGLVEIIDTPALAKAGARADKTVRKLTRADMLHRSGAIGKHHLAAITRYAESAELAYGSVVRATQYGEGGGSSPTGSASAAHSRQLNRAYDADRFIAARHMLPLHFRDAFDAVVLENQQIGTVGEQLYPALKSSTISGRMRDMVRVCAAALCVFYGIDADDQQVRLAGTMVRFDRQVRGNQAAEIGVRISDTITMDLLAKPDAAMLKVSPWVADEIRREHGLDDRPETFGGVPVLVMEHWAFAWMVEQRVTVAEAA